MGVDGRRRCGIGPRADAVQIVDARHRRQHGCMGIEYLAEGASTKRLHAGWAAQSGIRAALLARESFVGPRTVFEGVHGLFHGFAHTTEGDYDALTGDFGTRWVTDTLAFGPYPCGTMAQLLHRLGGGWRHVASRPTTSRRLSAEWRRNRTPAVGTASRQAAPAQRLCRQVRHAVSAGDRFCPRWGRTRRVHRNGHPRCGGAMLAAK